MKTTFQKDLKNLADKLPAENLGGKSILVTGATGLIGGAVVMMLLESKIDIQIYASSRSIEKLKKSYRDYLKDERLHMLQIDVTKPIDSEIRFNYIIDCASLGNPRSFKEAPVDIIKANIFGVSYLVEYGLKTGMERFVYVSSGEVYGEGDGRDFVEDYSGYVNPCEMRSAYPASKRAAESLCISYARQYNTQICIARPCHIYGPNFTENDDRAFAQFFRNIAQGNDIILKSLGLQIRSWLYVVDCAYALLFILLYGQSSTAYNISPSEEIASIKEFASIIATVGKKKIEYDCLNGNSQKPIINRGVLNSSRLHNLGWKEYYTLYDGVANTLKSILI